MISYGYGTVGFVLTLISLFHALFACAVALAVIMTIIYHQYRHHFGQEEKITLVLSLHIYSLLLITTASFTSMNIQTLIGDVYGTKFYTLWCECQGYWRLVTVCAMYYIFVVQAVFRLCRIMYSNCWWLRSYWTFLITAPVLVVGGGFLISPLLFLHDIVYFPNDHYCHVLSSNVRGILWTLSVIYTIPLSCILMIYIRITLFLRQQPRNISIVIKRRQQRDLVVIQRIFIIVGTLVVIGIPGITVILISFVTGIEPPLAQRITWITCEVSFAVLSVEMVLLTPQLRRLVMKRWTRNRVTAIECVIQMKPVTAVT